MLNEITYNPHFTGFDIEFIQREGELISDYKSKVLNINFKEGDFVFKNQILCEIQTSYKKEKVYMPSNGVINNIHFQLSDLIKIGKLLFTIEELDDGVFDDKVFLDTKHILDDTNFKIETDDFSDETTVSLNKVGGTVSGHLYFYARDNSFSSFFYIGLGLVNHQGYSYMDVVTNHDSISLSKGDSMIFLFDDKSKIEIVFQNNNYNNLYKSNSFAVNSLILESFLKKGLDKIKLISKRKNIYDVFFVEKIINYKLTEQIGESTINVFNIDKQYVGKYSGQYLLRLITYLFIKHHVLGFENLLEQ